MRAPSSRAWSNARSRVLDEQQEAVVAPFRARFPELNNMLEYRTASPAQAWQRIDAARLAIDADGPFGAALREALPQYGLQVAAGAAALRIVAAKHAGKLDRPGRHGRRAGMAALCLSTATRCSCWSPANGQALPGTPDFPALVTRCSAAAAATGLHAPAALAIAVHALCLALFERVALGQARNQDRLLTVDDATLTLGSHALTPYAVPRRDWQPPGTPLSAAQCGAGLRQDLGGSLLPDAGVAELNAIARSVQALTDERTGPLARADDGDLFQLPLASCLAHGAGSRVLMLGLSARETRNHAALWALEQRLAHNGPAHAGAAIGIGWNRCEALLRAYRRLFEHEARTARGPAGAPLADLLKPAPSWPTWPNCTTTPHRHAGYATTAAGSWPAIRPCRRARRSLLSAWASCPNWRWPICSSSWPLCATTTAPPSTRARRCWCAWAWTTPRSNARGSGHGLLRGGRTGIAVAAGGARRAAAGHRRAAPRRRTALMDGCDYIVENASAAALAQQVRTLAMRAAHVRAASQDPHRLAAIRGRRRPRTGRDGQRLAPGQPRLRAACQ
ncbi:hypothetical protein LP420_15990 [Massilia sp. B-10]|nr:hypothetical protein LP420_15990 [Massilia sp. B-10]